MNDAQLAVACNKFKDRDLKGELAFCAYNTQCGYMNQEKVEFYSWLCLAALRRIRALEAEGSADADSN